MSYTDVKYKFKKIGRNVQLGKNIYFRYPEKIEIGDNVIIDDFSYFSTSLVIEDYVHISPFCSVNCLLFFGLGCRRSSQSCFSIKLLDCA